MGLTPFVLVTDENTYIITPFHVRVIRYVDGEPVSSAVSPAFSALLKALGAWVRELFTTRWVEVETARNPRHGKARRR